MFLVFAGLVAAQPTTSVSPAPVATPASTEKTSLNDAERQELAEYRLAERVETRVVNDLRIYGAILGIALAIIGFIGFAAIRDTITRRVEKDLKNAIEKDVELFRSKIETTLVDAKVSLAETTRVGAKIQKQLEALQSKYSQLEDLSEKFKALHTDVSEMGQKVENALQVALETASKSDNLRQVVANSFAGHPAIVGGSYGWFENSPFTISGSNFGASPGKVRVLFYAHLDTDRVGPGFSVARWKMPEIEIDSNRIEKWSDNEIRFRLDNDVFRKIREFQEQVTTERVARGLNPVAFGYETKVETADGRFAISWEPPYKPL